MTISFASVFDSFQSIAQVSPDACPTRPSLPGTLFATELWAHEQLNSRLVEALHDLDPLDESGALSSAHLSPIFCYKLQNSRADQPGTEKQVSLLNINFPLAPYLDFSVLETTGIHLQNKTNKLTIPILILNLFV